MNKKLLLVFSLLLIFLVGMIRCQDAGGIFEGAEDEDDELVGGSNPIETQPIKEESTTEEKKVDATKSTTTTPSTASVEEDNMDEDEFEGLDSHREPAKPSTPTTQSTSPKPEVKKPTTAAENVNVRPLTWVDFIPEAITAILIAIYTSYYFLNRKVNETKILKWMEGNKDILVENFTSVKNIVKMSTNEFRIKCTGRLNCIGMEMNFSFKREHDLIYSFMDKFKPVDETVTIEFPVGATGTMPAFNLIMMNKNKIANYKKDNSTISAITNEVSDPKFPNNMNILTETKDLIPLVLSKDTRHTYKKLEKYIENVYINDNHYEQPEFPNFIRFVFRLPPTNQEFRELFLTCFDVLDRAVSLEMPKLVKEKVSKKRLELQKAKLRHEHEKREERSQQIKDEKKKRLLENKDDLSEKELSKLEQKEKKKSMKKSNGKMKRVVVG